jgi:hypothetical protein
MITVVNKSKLVTSGDVQLMTRACWKQLRDHAAPAWRMWPMPVVYASSEAQAPPGSWVIGVMDDPDQADALGWHWEDNGVIFGRVFVRPVLDNGGDVLHKPLSVASVLSHEVLETFVDPSCNRKASMDDNTDIALEIGDPVESDSYKVRVAGQDITVSNFVTEGWFDPQSDGPYDFMRLCAQPFQLRPGGYYIKYSGGGQGQAVFGHRYPGWRIETKKTELARSARRIHTQEL